MRTIYPLKELLSTDKRQYSMLKKPTLEQLIELANNPPAFLGRVTRGATENGWATVEDGSGSNVRAIAVGGDVERGNVMVFRWRSGHVAFGVAPPVVAIRRGLGFQSAPDVAPAPEVFPDPVEIAIILYRIRNGDALEHWVRFGDTSVLVKSVDLFGTPQTIQLASNSVDVGSDGIPGLWGGVSFAQVNSAGSFSTTDPQGEATGGSVFTVLYPDGIIRGGYAAGGFGQGTPTATGSYSFSSTGETLQYSYRLRHQVDYEVGGSLPTNDVGKAIAASIDITYSQIVPSKSWGHVVGGSLYVGIAWGMDENGFTNLEYYAVSSSGAVLENPPAGTAYKADRDLNGLAFDPTDVNSAAIAGITNRDLEFGIHGYAGPGNVRDQYWYLSDEPNFWVSPDTRDTIAAGGTLTLYKVESNNNTESIDVDISPVAIDVDSGQPTGFDNGFVGDGQELSFDDSFRASYSWLDQITGILRL